MHTITRGLFIIFGHCGQPQLKIGLAEYGTFGPAVDPTNYQGRHARKHITKESSVCNNINKYICTANYDEILKSDIFKF